MQNAWLWEEVLAADACFLPLVPASFYFAVPSLVTACLRMQTGLVKDLSDSFQHTVSASCVLGGLHATDQICF